MTTTLLIVAIILLLAVLGLQVAALLRKTPVDQEANERTERAVREEIASQPGRGFQGRTAIPTGSCHHSQECRRQPRSTAWGDAGNNRETLGVIQEESGKKLDQVRQESTAGIQKSREEVTVALKTFNESVGKTITDFVDWQRGQFAGVMDQLTSLTESNEKRMDEVRTAVEEKLKAIQEDNAKNLEQDASDRGRKTPGHSGKAAGRIIQAGQRAAGSRSTRVWAKCKAWPWAWAI